MTTKLRDCIAALASDTRHSWEGFVHQIHPLAWREAIRSTPRPELARALYGDMMKGLFEIRMDLPRRLMARPAGHEGEFVATEIDEQIGRWMLTLLPTQPPGGFTSGASYDVYEGTLIGHDVGAVLLQAFFCRRRSLAIQGRKGSTPVDPDDRFEHFEKALKADTEAASAFGNPPLLGGTIPIWVAAALGTSIHGVAELMSPVHSGLLWRCGARLRAYRGDGRFCAYLRTISVNLARDEARRTRPRSDHGPLDDDEGEPLPDLPPHPGPGPADAKEQADRQLIEQLEVEAVIDVVAKLPDDVRRILIARICDERKPREIAAAEVRDVQEIYRILERTLRRLKTVLRVREVDAASSLVEVMRILERARDTFDERLQRDNEAGGRTMP